MNGWMDRWMCEWTDGCVNGWEPNGRVCVCARVCVVAGRGSSQVLGPGCRVTIEEIQATHCAGLKINWLVLESCTVCMGAGNLP